MSRFSGDAILCNIHIPFSSCTLIQLEDEKRERGEKNGNNKKNLMEKHERKDTKSYQCPNEKNERMPCVLPCLSPKITSGVTLSFRCDVIVFVSEFLCFSLFFSLHLLFLPLFHVGGMKRRMKGRMKRREEKHLQISKSIKLGERQTCRQLPSPAFTCFFPCSS